MSSGRAFHAAGPAGEKARSPHFVRSCGIAKFVVEENRRPARERLSKKKFIEMQQPKAGLVQ